MNSENYSSVYQTDSQMEFVYQNMPLTLKSPDSHTYSIFTETTSVATTQSIFLNSEAQVHFHAYHPYFAINELSVEGIQVAS